MRKAFMFCWRMWGVFRHFLSVRSLLQWTGKWETVVASATGIGLALWAFVKGLSAPVDILMALLAFAATSVAWRAWKSPMSMMHGLGSEHIVGAHGLEFAGWIPASSSRLPVHWPTESEKSNWLSIRNPLVGPPIDAKNVTASLDFINSDGKQRRIIPEVLWWEIGGVTPKGNERVAHAQHSVDILSGDDQAFLFFSQDSNYRAIPYKDTNEPLEPLSNDRWKITLRVSSDNLEGFEASITFITTRDGIVSDRDSQPFTRLLSVPPRLGSVQ
jgi:hypothetical protein